MSKKEMPAMKIFGLVALVVMLSTSEAFVFTPSQRQTSFVPTPHPSSHLFFSEEGSGVSEVVTESPAVAEVAPPEPPVKCPNCDMCDGSGRIQGGIGLVLTWWPIKAYRPCPNFVNAGGNYERTGQGLDEIAFGRANLPDDM
eukprot:CAMPEP_0195538420 /NCGR_PEP_ID=MMETSP0794_2-20130614/49519_1 /TAXON_ID=515487 /ORGANISM="Stephanopyxis turris, Strain CCMP 815" /LENGTH=141 /DNA_ID=CAMNT_0040672397 /DNA_START=528 /DNA_END=953 /DNA_ORIENTATION=-